MQETSLEAYHAITEEEFSNKHRAVLFAFKMSGPMTNRELSSALGWPINTVTPRVNELVKLGILQSNGTKFDVQTQRRALVWGIADKSNQMAFA